MTMLTILKMLEMTPLSKYPMQEVCRKLRVRDLKTPASSFHSLLILYYHVSTGFGCCLVVARDRL